MRKYIITFLVGFLCASIGAGFFVYSSIQRAGQDRAKYNELESTNQRLRDSNTIRQTEIERLSSYAVGLENRNRELESLNSEYGDSIIERQRIITSAKQTIAGTQDSITKLRAILILIQKLE